MRPHRSNRGRTICGPLVAAAVAVTASSAEFATAQTTHQVELDGILFIPADLTVQTGDTVHWVWVSGFHNVESGEVVGGAGVHDGNFRSGDPTVAVGTAFEIVFDEAFLSANPMSANVYPYFCIVHASVNMTGTITVVDAGCVSNQECDDGDACNGSETCQGGECVGGTAPNCNDQNTCTDDSCDPASGCVNTDNTAACDDGDACTTGDTCSAGVCVGGAAPNCDDGDVCSGVESCQRGRCVSTGALDCNDSNSCTDDTCDPQTGCHSVANDSRACSDGDVCTTDACVGGVCIGTSIADCFSCVGAGECDDGNPCTDDTCDRATCIHINNVGSCDDGDPCAGGDVCAGGVCAGESISGCCVTVADCEAIACMESQCASGVCARMPISGCTSCDSSADCDDGNACTDDACDQGACVNESNQAPCDDGDPCTEGDVCVSGACEGTQMDTCCAADDECDDGDLCTDDACVSSSCVHTAIAGCEDNPDDDGDMDGTGSPLPDDDSDGSSPPAGRRLCGAIGMATIVGVLVCLGTLRVCVRSARRRTRGSAGERS